MTKGIRASAVKKKGKWAGKGGLPGWGEREISNSKKKPCWEFCVQTGK